MEFGLFFTYLATVVGVIGGLMNPMVGILVYQMFALIRPTHLWFWAFGGTERFSQLVAIATLGAWVMNGFGDRGLLKPVRWPLIGYGVYLLAGLAGYQFAALHKGHSWLALDIQLKIGLMMIVTLTLIRTSLQIRAFAWMVAISLGYLAWVFNHQYYFDGWNRVWMRGFGGIDNNGTAMIMVLGIPLLFFMGINAPKLWIKLLCGVLMLCQAHVVLFSFSRGGQLGMLMVGIGIFTVALMKLPRRGLTILAGVATVIVVLQLAGAEVREEFWSIFADKEERDASAASRFDTWAGAWACMLDHPLIGMGPRGFNTVSHQYGLPPNKSVHSLFLQTGADYGFTGLFGLMLFFFGTMWPTFRMAWSPTAQRLVWPAYFGYMVCLSLGGFMICSVFIGMESVVACYIISMIGLMTVTYVKRMETCDAEILGQPIELEEVPPPGTTVDDLDDLDDLEGRPHLGPLLPRGEPEPPRLRETLPV